MPVTQIATVTLTDRRLSCLYMICKHELRSQSRQRAGSEQSVGDTLPSGVFQGQLVLSSAQLSSAQQAP